jgi:hypothetical protein
MALFNNGKGTSSVIFYDRGVPNHFHSFGLIASMNYSVLKTIASFNTRHRLNRFYQIQNVVKFKK